VLFFVRVNEFPNFLFVLLCLRVVDRETSHEHICRVVILPDPVTQTLEVARALLGFALIDNVAITHQDQSIEVSERLRRRLVDRGANCFALPCDFFKNSNDSDSCEAIEARGWFIKENDVRDPTYSSDTCDSPRSSISF
jgi:hypothetical protein